MDGTRQRESSRRAVVTAGIATGTTALAGCLGGTGVGPASGDERGSYTVTMAPMGDVGLDAVLENASVTFTPGQACPAIPADEQLFDRERVGTIVTGASDQTIGFDRGRLGCDVVPLCGLTCDT